MTIFIDVDGVVAETVEFACAIASLFGVEVTADMITCQNPVIDGFDMGALITRVANDPRLNRYIERDRKALIETIDAYLPVCFLTARPASSKTGDYLMEHVNVRPLKVIYTTEKWREAKQPGDVLIDDNLEQCIAWAATGHKALLLDRPWNQAEELSAGVVRCANWIAVRRELGIYA